MAGSARSGWSRPSCPLRSEEHTSELQSRSDLVCRLLLEKKKKKEPNDNALKQITLVPQSRGNRGRLHSVPAAPLCESSLKTDTSKQTLTQSLSSDVTEI